MDAPPPPPHAHTLQRLVVLAVLFFLGLLLGGVLTGRLIGR